MLARFKCYVCPLITIVLRYLSMERSETISPTSLSKEGFGLFYDAVGS
jgi:hypothetical protein